MKNVRNWHAIIVTKRKKEEERMKVMKKIATFILSVCLIVPCFGMLTYAADGQIVFSDVFHLQRRKARQNNVF